MKAIIKFLTSKWGNHLMLFILGFLIYFSVLQGTMYVIILGVLLLVLYGFFKRKFPSSPILNPIYKMLNLYRKLILILLIFIGINYVIKGVSYKTITVRITKTESKVHKGDNMYMVYTDKGTLKCTDDWYFLKFNSSKVYSRLEAGKTYKLKVTGFRNIYLSSYPNILFIEE